MGTTLHAWLKLVTDRMPEPLVRVRNWGVGTGGVQLERGYGAFACWSMRWHSKLPDIVPANREARITISAQSGMEPEQLPSCYSI